MKAAYNLIRAEPFYRRDAFTKGLEACGYQVRPTRPTTINRGDVLVIWNRYSDNHLMASRFEQEGGLVLVAENGYIGRGGISPHSMETRDPYALARSWHNDEAVMPIPQGDRFGALGVEVKPWRSGGGHILVCPNRSFGAPGRAMPADWSQSVRQRLAGITKREIRVRPHPGNNAPAKPLAEDLEGAHACVIWSSSAGVHALVAGIPVVCEAPFWAARLGTYAMWFEDMDPPSEMDAARRMALQQLAWGQWFVDEIASGAAFKAVLP